MKSLFPLLASTLALLSIACNLTRALTENTITANQSEPPATEIPSPTPATTPSTDTPQPQAPESIVYYYFVEMDSESPPSGSVVILPDVLILGPTITDVAGSPDTAAKIGSALKAMLNDPRNAWISNDVGITSISFDDGAVNVVLEGEYFGAGDVVLIAARDQLLLTVFSEPSVQTARITLNGKNIANLGISHSSQAKPDDYTFTRAHVEAFMEENAYEMP